MLPGYALRVRVGNMERAVGWPRLAPLVVVAIEGEQERLRSRREAFAQSIETPDKRRVRRGWVYAGGIEHYDAARVLDRVP